jgi:hypothetical protein
MKSFCIVNFDSSSRYLEKIEENALAYYDSRLITAKKVLQPRHLKTREKLPSKINFFPFFVKKTISIFGLLKTPQLSAK